jgi:hypothetical protein
MEPKYTNNEQYEQVTFTECLLIARQWFNCLTCINPLNAHKQAKSRHNYYIYFNDEKNEA